MVILEIVWFWRHEFLWRHFSWSLCTRFYNNSFRRCRPNFLVLQKEHKILVHNLSIYEKLEQSTHWIIQKKWGKDFTFGSDCTVDLILTGRKKDLRQARTPLTDCLVHSFRFKGQRWTHWPWEEFEEERSTWLKRLCINAIHCQGWLQLRRNSWYSKIKYSCCRDFYLSDQLKSKMISGK